MIVIVEAGDLGDRTPYRKLGEPNVPSTLKSHKHDSRRNPVLRAGNILFRGVSVGCFVLNVSAGGAGLVVESDVVLPFAFDPEIDGERIRRRCLAVWRIERQMGVTFDSGRTNTEPGAEQVG